MTVRTEVLKRYPPGTLLKCNYPVRHDSVDSVDSVFGNVDGVYMVICCQIQTYHGPWHVVVMTLLWNDRIVIREGTVDYIDNDWHVVKRPE